MYYTLKNLSYLSFAGHPLKYSVMDNLLVCHIGLINANLALQS